MAQSFEDHVRIYAQNALQYPDLFDTESHQAVVYFQKKNKFVIKNRFCLNCNHDLGYEACMENSKQLFQQELGYFYIRDDDIEPKVRIKYTFAYLVFPEIQQEEDDDTVSQSGQQPHGSQKRRKSIHATGSAS